MTLLIVKTLVSAVLIVTVSEMARRSPVLGALVASLPLVSVLAMIWLWRETHDAERIAQQAEATLWYVLPSLPMFVAMPLMLRAGFGFWTTLGASVALTAVLYVATAAMLARFGIEI
ncbi:MAG: DUF3147 family protein [Hyphomicrobiaceae bacterium]